MQTSSSTTVVSDFHSGIHLITSRGLQGRLLSPNAKEYAFLVWVSPHPEVQRDEKIRLSEVQELASLASWINSHWCRMERNKKRIHPGRQGHKNLPASNTQHYSRFHWGNCLMWSWLDHNQSRNAYTRDFVPMTDISKSRIRLLTPVSAQVV